MLVKAELGESTNPKMARPLLARPEALGSRAVLRSRNRTDLFHRSPAPRPARRAASGQAYGGRRHRPLLETSRDIYWRFSWQSRER